MADITKKEMEAAIKKAVEETNKARDEAEAGLKKKVDELLAEKKTEAEKAKAAQEEAVKAAEEAARKSGDVKALDESWKEKFARLEAEKAEAEKEAKALVGNLTIGATAKDIAAALAVKGSEKVIERLAAERIGVDISGGTAKVTVLDATGKPSALTVDELKAELAADPALKPIIAGSAASGGGAAGASGGASGKTITRETYEAMTPQEQATIDFASGVQLVD